MRLVCPSCGKAHIVREEALLPAGRNVRCSSCKSMWFADASGQHVRKKSAMALDSSRGSKQLVEQAQRAAGSGAAGSGASRSTAQKPHRRAAKALTPRRFKIDAGAALFGALLMTLASGVVFRDSVVRHFPSLSQLYAAAGMKVNVRGFEFAGLTTTREHAEGGQILVVSGKITNISGHDAPVPPLKIVLRSPTGAEIHMADAAGETKTLSKDGETVFKTVLANPPEDAKDVLVRFSGAIISGS